MTKISKTPWELDFRKDEHGCQCAVLFDADGNAIADGYNSDVICIHEEADEDGVSRWDDQGRANFEFIVKAVNDRSKMSPREDNAETEEFFSCSSPLHEALLWLQSALDCKAWEWAPEQRQMAESALRAAQADVAKLTANPAA